ncbi:MAG: SMP-30/gluconolactonase/LRE family protein [Candidatus Binataceae bacterium]
MEFELLASGYEIIEGPRVDANNRLYFSDAGDNGGVYRRNPDGAVETLIAGRDRVGGIALNAAGGLIVTGWGLILWDEAAGRSRDLFTHWEGKKINVFNDPRRAVHVEHLSWCAFLQSIAKCDIPGWCG